MRYEEFVEKNNDKEVHDDGGGGVRGTGIGFSGGGRQGGGGGRREEDEGGRKEEERGTLEKQRLHTG